MIYYMLFVIHSNSNSNSNSNYNYYNNELILNIDDAPWP